MMTTTRTDGSQQIVPFETTLWRCSNCSSLVSIYARGPVNEAFCPVCVEMPLELCGTIGCFASLQVADA